MKFLNSVKRVLKKFPLCDECLGRLFKNLKPKSDNKELALSIRKSLEIERTEPEECYLCKGASEKVDEFSDKILEKSKDYEFDSFLIGINLSKDFEEREDKLLEEEIGQLALRFKDDFKRKIGKAIFKKTGKRIDFENPDVIPVLSIPSGKIFLQIKPLYIYGRYLKKKRGVPQTKWFCRACRGKGCKECNFTGKMFSTSVEEMIAHKAVQMVGAGGEAFHGEGREDEDVLMLGRGRPFVLELKNPRKRTLDLKVLQEKINRKYKGIIEVRELALSEKTKIQQLKSASHRKLYRASVKGEGNFTEEIIKKLEKIFNNCLLIQQTPIRVSERRADMERERKVFKFRVLEFNKSRATFLIEAQAGTYIKELISGDSGRTKPNVSDVCSFLCEVEELDVLEIIEKIAEGKNIL